MLTTIDGPAGSGKSTVAKLLAVKLSEMIGFTVEYLDTGSMYRSIALLGLRAAIDWDRPEQLIQLAQKARVDVDAARTFLDGEDVTDQVRLPEVTDKTRFAADNPSIRRLMVERQREIARQYQNSGKGLVAEGRDQGSVVFPNATCKFFVTASPEERARRRCEEFQKRGIVEHFETVLQSIRTRDKRDQEREVGPLVEPADAVRIVTDNLTIGQVVDLLVKTVLNCVKIPDK